MPRPPQFFDVPAGTRAAQCSSCRATVYWIVTLAGKRMPVDCDIEGGYVPDGDWNGGGQALSPQGRGVSHFVTCPNRDQHRRPR